MDKNFFLESFATYSDEQLLQIVIDRNNRQIDAVMAAQELLSKRGHTQVGSFLEVNYNKEISDIPRRISVLKAVRLFLIVLVLLSLAVRWTLFNNNVDQSGNNVPVTLNRIIVIECFIITLLTVYFSIKIAKLKEEQKNEKIVDALFDKQE